MSRPSRWERVVRAIGAWPVAVVVSLGIAALAVVYAGPQRGARGLDGEHDVPAAFSAAVLGGAALSAWVYGHSGAVRGWTRRAVLAFAVLLGFFMLDEALVLHERPEQWTGLDWQVVYAPVVLVGAVVGVTVLAHFARSDPPRWWSFGLATGGALVWAVSQVLEAVQWDGDVLAHPALIYYEELLEVSGSLLLGLAMLVALRRTPVTTDRDAAAPGEHDEPARLAR